MADYQILVKVVLDKTNLQPELDKLGEQISKKVSEKASKGKPVTVPIDVSVDEAKIQARINSVINSINQSGGPKVESFFATSGEKNRVVETYNTLLGESVTITRNLIKDEETQEQNWIATVKYTNDAIAQQKIYQGIYAEGVKLSKEKMDALHAEANAENAMWEKRKSSTAEYVNKLDILKAKNKEAFADPAVQKAEQAFIQARTGIDGTTRSLSNAKIAWSNLNREVQVFNAGTQNVNKNGMNLMRMFELAAKKVLIWAGATSLIYGSLQEIRKSVEFMKDLNKEMTNIQIVSGATDSEIGALARDYNKLAKEVGATTVEVAKGSVEWIRQGKTLDETTTLLKDSMMLAKLAGMESSEATTLLTSTMAGFKMSVDDVLPALDKLIAVDNAFATSSKEVAAALQYSAAVANQAGVSYDQLVAYITTVSSVTRMSAETIGQSFKTMFTRMEQVKVGKIFEDDTTTINQVGQALDSVGIKLMENADTFRPMGDVLADLAGKWDTLTTKQQNAIAGTIAGIRQVPQFLTLMQNWAMVTKAQGIEMDAAGLATERYKVYLQGLEATTNKFTATWEEMWMKTFNSDTIKSIINAGTAMLQLTSDMGGLVPVIISVVAALLLYKNAVVAATLVSLVSQGKLLIDIFRSLPAIITLARAEMISFGVASTAAMAAATMGISLLFGAIIYMISTYNSAASRAERLADSFNAAKEEIAGITSKINGIRDNITTIRELSDEFDTLKDKTKKSTEEQKRWLDIQNQLKQIIPELNGYYDTQGNYIVDITTKTGVLIDKLKEQLEIELKLSKIANTKAANAAQGKYEEDLKRLYTLKNTKEFLTDKSNIMNEKDRSQMLESVNKELIDLELTVQQDYLTWQKFNNLLDNTGDKYDRIAESVKKYGEATTYLDSRFDFMGRAFKNAQVFLKDFDLSNLISQDNALMKIMDDMQENGEITPEQYVNLQQLYPEDYLTFTSIIGDQFKLNTQALKEFMVAQIQEVITAIEVTAATEGWTDALRNKVAVLKTIQQQIGNYDPAVAKLDSQKAYNDLLKDTIDMIKQEKEAQKQALQEELEAFRKKIEEEKRLIDEKADKQKQKLQDELDGYEKIIDAEKDLLDAKQREADFQDELAEKNKSLSDIEAELLELQFDNSEEAKARRLQLEADKADKLKEINKLQADNTLQNEKDALDKELEKFKEIIEKKQKAIELAAKKQKALLDKELREFEIANLARQKSIEDYLRQSGKITADAMALLDSRSNAFYQKLLAWNQKYGTSIADDIIKKWQEAFNLLEKLKQWQPGKDSPPWMQPPGTPPPLPFHSGGVVGGMPKIEESETFAKLVRGEIVVTEGQAFSFLQSTLPKLFSVANKGGGDINVPIEITVMGNLDRTVLPDLKETILSTLNEAMRSRGIRRDAFSYSL